LKIESGIVAKPVVDIQITVPALEPLDAWVDRLAPLGYTHQSSPDDDRYPFFHRPASWPYTHHVHLCPPASAVGRATLALRDYLRASTPKRGMHTPRRSGGWPRFMSAPQEDPVMQGVRYLDKLIDELATPGRWERSCGRPEEVWLNPSIGKPAPQHAKVGSLTR
jgi:hypothetical protein